MNSSNNTVLHAIYIKVHYLWVSSCRCMNNLRKKVLLLQKMGLEDGDGTVAPGKALFKMTKCCDVMLK